MPENEEQVAQTTLVEDASASDMLQVIKMVNNHEDRLRKLERLTALEPERLSKAKSIREFLLEKNPKSDVEKTFVVGYFLERNRNFASFNARDLSSGFREAKEPVPANVNLTALKNVQKGHFMEAAEKKDGLKAWSLTNSGLNLLESQQAT